jgi:putative transposase
MARRKYTVEEIVTVLRQVEIATGNGRTTPHACREAGITEQTFYRWRKEYGGLKLEQAKRFKDLKGLGTGPLCIEPGSPWENGYCESFNSKLRDECLNDEIFYSLREAQVVIERWRVLEPLVQACYPKRQPSLNSTDFS